MGLQGFGIGNYRSFREIQRFGPLSRVNFVAGQNNAGKSNVIRFLSQHTHSMSQALAESQSFKADFDQSDLHVGATGTWNPIFSVCLDRSSLDTGGRIQPGTNAHVQLDDVLDRLDDGSGIVWLDLTVSSRQIVPEKSFLEATYNAVPPNSWNMLCEGLLSRSGGIPEDRAADVFMWIARSAPQCPKVSTVPAFRQMISSSADESSPMHSGHNLIARLAQLQHPNPNERSLRDDFDQLNRFLQCVLEDESAELEVTHDASRLLVTLQGLTLPIEDLGTGIQEVIIIAAAATMLHDQILCIEEPEIHLHPSLQRKLIRYLDEATDNQYLIATHSAHLLDSVSGSATFHLRRINLATTAERVVSGTSRSSLCADLGYRASDLVQANSVVWVEGPSDRIYLRYWLSAYASELVEGVHYSIMFYGGRLLSHLSADDTAVTDFISLRSLNRYSSILIDSDRSTARTALNATKRRIRTEFDSGPGFAWITNGREIENYIPQGLLLSAIQQVHPKAASLTDLGRFGHQLRYRRSDSRKIRDATKVDVARAAVGLEPTLDFLDLRKQIKRAAQFIRKANGLPTS